MCCWTEMYHPNMILQKTTFINYMSSVGLIKIPVTDYWTVFLPPLLPFVQTTFLPQTVAVFPSVYFIIDFWMILPPIISRPNLMFQLEMGQIVETRCSQNANSLWLYGYDNMVSRSHIFKWNSSALARLSPLTLNVPETRLTALKKKWSHPKSEA